ncbi:MAG: nitrate transporter ATP-binding protein [Myxococcaceae bacterium]|nr:nitrate transporter ATP-binding protein [Myxococcaceae bacterium]
MAKLELKGVCKGFGTGAQRREILSDINLTIEDREIVAVVGYSGVGKTTLVSLIAGLITPDRGTITLDGKLVTGPGRDRGVVFQNYALLPWLTTYQNVALAVDEAFPELPAAQRRERVESALALVSLSAAHQKRPRELSGGMRQRVSIARALAMDPEVLLLDEPFGALDALTRGTLQKEVENIFRRQAKTMVMITNDVEEAVLLADRIIPLSLGPSAKLGPEVRVDLARPRDKKTLSTQLDAKRMKVTVIDYLLGQAAEKRAARATSRTAEQGR